MKKIRNGKTALIILMLLAIAAILVAIAIPNFLKFQAKARSHYPYPTLASFETGGVFSPAHGGSKVVNGQAYDAMFFESHGVNPFIDTEDDHLSTFGVDVDTASYTIGRSYIFRGALPPKEAVRTEEFINYFKYDYPSPEEEAIAIDVEGAPSKFGEPGYHMLRIGLKAKEVEPVSRKDAVLTFVIDVSGSMAREHRLELVKNSLKLLMSQMREGDSVGIVVYSTRARVLMEHRGIENSEEIIDAIEKLYPENSTNADEGLRLGYSLAWKAFRPDAINRIILCTDGVANEAQTDAVEILRNVNEYTQRGITLTAIGFGMGNYNDILLEKLADKGNGSYAYVDTIEEARRVFIENLTGNIQLAAKDAKVQVDFNPEVVARYRLLGYENRDIRDNEFRNNRVDAGEIGAGQQVTALYEIKFQKLISESSNGKVAEVTLRYKDPDKEENVTEQSRIISVSDFQNSYDSTTPDFQLAVIVSEFAEILKKSYWAKDGSLQEVLLAAEQLPDVYRNRQEIVELIDIIYKASKLSGTTDEQL